MVDPKKQFAEILFGLYLDKPFAKVATSSGVLKNPWNLSQ